YDGTSATRVTDLSPGSGGSYPGTFTPFKGALYFLASQGTSDRYLWTLAPLVPERHAVTLKRNDYVARPAAATFTDISGTGTAIDFTTQGTNGSDIDDNAAFVYPGSFQFTFYGQTYSYLCVSTNGLITFNSENHD